MFDRLVVFSVSRPQDYAGMVPKSMDVLYGFFSHACEIQRVCWVVSAIEHEVLPYQHAKLVSCVVQRRCGSTAATASRCSVLEVTFNGKRQDQ
jgi:hypothetical protein